MINEKKFNELLENKDFMQEIISMETLEEVQGGFAKQGVEVSKDEVEQLGEVIKEVNEKISKLSNDELNLIVGGYQGDFSGYFSKDDYSVESTSGVGIRENSNLINPNTSKSPRKGFIGKAIIGVTVASALGSIAIGFGTGLNAWWKENHH